RYASTGAHSFCLWTSAPIRPTSMSAPTLLTGGRSICSFRWRPSAPTQTNAPTRPVLTNTLLIPLTDECH
ncbi:hypothetical protein H4R19_005652, partial [Coemansia spiralis]